MFLEKHGSSLQNVRDDASRARWHRDFAADWGPHAKALAASANATYGLSGDVSVQSDLGYLVAESAPDRQAERTLILLSANPGWVQALNAVERGLKGQSGADGTVDLGAYERYRTQFFPRWYNEVIWPAAWQRGMWWNNALNFLHKLAGIPVPPRMCQLDPRLRVLGWELWPMHSARDGLSGAATLDPTLKEFAKQSILAALRTPCAAVIVASAAGFDMLEELKASGHLEVRRATIGGVEVTSWAGAEGGADVFAVRRQLFAGWSRPNRETFRKIIEFCRGCDPAPLAASRTSVARRGALDVSPAGPPITLRPADAVGPLIWVRPVNGAETHALGPLLDGAAEEEVHQRIGGYWILGFGARGSRGAQIRDALQAGRRVFVLGKVGNKVLRMVEVSRDPYLPPAPRERIGTLTFDVADAQSRTLEWPGGGLGRWGTEFLTGGPGSATRVRIHTASVDDGEWVGRMLAGPSLRGQNPGLFTTDELLPIHYER